MWEVREGQGESAEQGMRHGVSGGARPAGSFRYSCLFSTPLLPCGEALQGALGSLGAKIQATYGGGFP